MLGHALGVQGDDDGAESGIQEFAHQCVMILFPDRQHGLEAGAFADPFLPLAVGIKVDVAEYASARVQGNGRLEQVDEGGLVAFPGGATEEDGDADGVSLGLEDRSGQTVGPGMLPVLRQHVDER